MINITLPDGSVRQYEEGASAMDVAKSISEGLARNVLAAKVNGEVWDASRPIHGDASLAGFTTGQNPFTTVVMAEHALRGVELDLVCARADLDHKTAALDRAEGRVPGGGR